MSYIVTNCPCFVLGIAMKGNDKKVQTCNNYRISELTHCSDITDCVIKQVIQECRKSIKCFESNDIACPVCSDAASAELAQEILQLFDIEEINK